MTVTHCCVVEDHNDIVPFLQACVRKKLCHVPPSGLLFVHLDAHPDMAVPTMTCTTAWQNLSSLHDVLEADASGISQFVIPLVTLGILSRVVWVRSPWSDQLADGQHRFHVGDVSDDDRDREGEGDGTVGSGRLAAATLPTAYYLDDDSYRPAADLSNARPVDLTVLCLPCITGTDADETVAIGDAAEGDAWVLDICLDYFSTMNPFRPMLEEALARDLLQPADSVAALEAVENVFRFMPFRHARHADVGEGEQAGQALRRLRNRCYALLERLLKPPTTAAATATDDDAAPSAKRPRHDGEVGPERAAEDEMAALYGPDRAHHVRALAALVPRLSRATCDLVLDVGPAALLPHHPSTDAEVTAMLARVSAFLRAARVGGRPLGRPALVTVARSAADGFTPAAAVDALQERVLGAVRDLLATHWGGGDAALVVHDLTQDAAARAYTMFLHPAARLHCVEQS